MTTHTNAEAKSTSPPTSMMPPAHSSLLPQQEQEEPARSLRAEDWQRSSNPPIPPPINPSVGHNFGSMAIGPTTLPMLQRKLAIGQPNAQYKQEADRVADQVMRMPERSSEENSDGMQPQSLIGTITPLVQRQDSESETEENEIQTKKSVGQMPDVTPQLATRLQSQLGKGQALPEKTHALMETHFTRNFGDVKVHTDAEAVQMNRELNAQAFTHQQDVFFGAGRYSPESEEGKRLLAHELTHVAQQKSIGTNGLTWSLVQKSPEKSALSKPEISSNRKDSLTDNAPNASQITPTAPINTTNSEALLEKKRILDNELEQDFGFIVKKLDEIHYSNSDEGEVISILKKWSNEKFTDNPKRYPEGGEYLDRLFLKLSQKHKDVGIVTSQLTSYYSLIFNHFGRVNEIKPIRDQHSRIFRGDDGIKELSFGSFFWEEVKEGKVRDQIFAYFEGMVAAVVGMAEGFALLLNHPEQVIKGIGNLPSTAKVLWKNKEKIWNDFLNAKPEDQARVIGRLFGEAELLILTVGAGSGERAATAAPELATATEIAGMSGGAGVLSGGQAITINLGQLGVEAGRITALMSKTTEVGVKSEKKAGELKTEGQAGAPQEKISGKPPEAGNKKPPKATELLQPGKSPLKEFDIDQYGTFRNRPGDALAGHEMLQNAWLKAKGFLKKRGVGTASRQNPAVAVSKKIHDAISKAQNELGLNDPSKLLKMTATENIELNAQAMRKAGVPEDVIQVLKSEALKHAASLSE